MHISDAVMRSADGRDADADDAGGRIGRSIIRLTPSEGGALFSQRRRRRRRRLRPSVIACKCRRVWHEYAMDGTRVGRGRGLGIIARFDLRLKFEQRGFSRQLRSLIRSSSILVIPLPR